MRERRVDRDDQIEAFDHGGCVGEVGEFGAQVQGQAGIGGQLLRAEPLLQTHQCRLLGERGKPIQGDRTP